VLPQKSQPASINQVSGIEDQGDRVAETMEAEGTKPDQEEAHDTLD